MRHPLHAIKTMMGVAPGLASLNPLGWYSATKCAYHLSKANEFQDERMRILHGDTARQYQEKTSAFIPGTNQILAKFDPNESNSFVQSLRTPASHYLEKIPFIKSERYKTDSLNEMEEFHKGNPNLYVGSPLEQNTREAPIMRGPQAILHNLKDTIHGINTLITAPYHLTKFCYNQYKQRTVKESPFS